MQLQKGIIPRINCNHNNLLGMQQGRKTQRNKR